MRIGIIGAGIGGLVAAAALQGDGHDVRVYERREDSGALGAGLTLFGNALAALDTVGLGELVRSVSSLALGRLRSGQRHPSGHWLLSLPPSETPGVRSLHRADLHRALVQHLRPGTIRLSAVASVAADGAPVVHVDGEEHPVDLVIAADGIRSDARARWGLDRGIRYAGYTAWRGITTTAGHLADEAGETWGRGARFGIVPLPDDRVYWFATHQTPPGGTDDDVLATLHSLFGNWHAPIGALLAATPPEAVLRHDIYDLVALPASFVHSRGVLLGDAAHAMTPDLGQGAGQAIEDAATLALLLRGASRQHLEGALTRYGRLRRPRTRGLWRQSRLTGRIGQAAHPATATLRDVVLRAVPSAVAAVGMARAQRWSPPLPGGFDG